MTEPTVRELAAFHFVPTVAAWVEMDDDTNQVAPSLFNLLGCRVNTPIRDIGRADPVYFTTNLQ